jgi:hypothetical protein
MLALCACEYLNEQRHAIQIDEHVNKPWSQLRSLIPFNATWWVYQTGVTRKIQIMTGAVALLLLLTYYQCNLLHQLLIPKPVPRITVADIAHAVTTRTSTVQFAKRLSAFEHEIEHTSIGELSLLSQALKNNTPMYGKENVLKDIISNNVVFIDSRRYIYGELLNINPGDCVNYALVRVPLAHSIFYPLLLSKRRKDVVNELNIIIADRFLYVNRMNEERQPSETCLRYIQSDDPPDPSYTSLHLQSLSFSFAFLIILLCCCTVTLLVEVGIHRRTGCAMITVVQEKILVDEVVLLIDLEEYSSMQRHLIMHECRVFVDRVNACFV